MQVEHTIKVTHKDDMPYGVAVITTDDKRICIKLGYAQPDYIWLDEEAIRLVLYSAKDTVIRHGDMYIIMSRDENVIIFVSVRIEGKREINVQFLLGDFLDVYREPLEHCLKVLEGR